MRGCGARYQSVQSALPGLPREQPPRLRAGNLECMDNVHTAVRRRATLQEPSGESVSSEFRQTMQGFASAVQRLQQQTLPKGR
mmetsp:Transcript_138661/g.241297  ORF Transcript_138661/g.241297 Transcript_138661/m.241297 type:complete len:83 (+) Transcript_138661:176-424(+)